MLTPLCQGLQALSVLLAPRLCFVGQLSSKGKAEYCNLSITHMKGQIFLSLMLISLMMELGFSKHKLILNQTEASCLKAAIIPKIIKITKPEDEEHK